MTRLRRFLAALWRPIRENARKLIPSRAVRWVAIYSPPLCVAVILAAKTLGYDDLAAYVIEAGSRSVPVVISIAITYAVATGLGWNLDNEYRARLQRILESAPLDRHGDTVGRGAFLILAGEMLSILSLLIVVLAALLVFQ